MVERRNTPRWELPVPEGFARFWAAYPRKVGKLAALARWHELQPSDALVEKMLETLAWQVRQPAWQHGEIYIPHAKTWLNQGRWEDEPFEAEHRSVSRRTLALEAAEAEFLRETTPQKKLT